MEEQIEKRLPIKEYEGLYEVSNQGRVRSLDRKVVYSKGGIINFIGKQLKPIINNKGYLTVWLKNRKKRKLCKIHRLVAQAFIPNPDNKPQVNHIDGDKLNNNVDNLEWCTNSENMEHAIKNNLIKRSKGESHYCSKLTEKEVLEIRELYATGNYFQKELGEKYGVINTHIGKIIRKELWKHI